VKLSEMREVLDAARHPAHQIARPEFSARREPVAKNCRGRGIIENDKVLEIGPGLGPLTELLLEKAGEVLAIEMDGGSWNFCAHERFAIGEKSDCFTTTRWNFCKREPRDWSDWKLVANLPYSVASPILVELAQSPRRPERMVTTLQLEVAQRLMAQADDDDYGVLTLLVQLDYEPRAASRFRRTVFSPRRTWIRCAWFCNAAPGHCSPTASAPRS
jgi:16S rRNA (adenine1518-N6/adenine1519-N6)-dimethyltransferase